MIILIDGKRKKIYGRCNKCYSIEIAQLGIIGKDRENVIISLVKCAILVGKDTVLQDWCTTGVNWCILEKNGDGFDG